MADETRGYRRLVLSMLLRAVLDARRGDAGAVAWLGSDCAHDWADLLGLDEWPPQIMAGNVPKRAQYDLRAGLGPPTAFLGPPAGILRALGGIVRAVAESRITSMPDWITTQQAAELSAYTPEHIRRLVKAGKVKGQRWGRDWQIERRSLLAYVKAAQKLGEKRGPRAAD